MGQIGDLMEAVTTYPHLGSAQPRIEDNFKEDRGSCTKA